MSKTDHVLQIYHPRFSFAFLLKAWFFFLHAQVVCMLCTVCSWLKPGLPQSFPLVPKFSTHTQWHGGTFCVLGGHWQGTAKGRNVEFGLLDTSALHFQLGKWSSIRKHLVNTHPTLTVTFPFILTICFIYCVTLWNYYASRQPGLMANVPRQQRESCVKPMGQGELSTGPGQQAHSPSLCDHSCCSPAPPPPGWCTMQYWWQPVLSSHLLLTLLSA